MAVTREQNAVVNMRILECAICIKSAEWNRSTAGEEGLGPREVMSSTPYAAHCRDEPVRTAASATLRKGSTFGDIHQHGWFVSQCEAGLRHGPEALSVISPTLVQRKALGYRAEAPISHFIRIVAGLHPCSSPVPPVGRAKGPRRAGSDGEQTSQITVSIPKDDSRFLVRSVYVMRFAPPVWTRA